jgi:hypothetical protein
MKMIFWEFVLTSPTMLILMKHTKQFNYDKRGQHKNPSINHFGYTEGNELDKLGREK